MLKERLKGVIIGVAATLALTAATSVLGKAITSTIQVTYRNIGVSVDGRVIVTEEEPFIYEGRTYLAVRDIAEAFNSDIKMNETTNTVEITSRQTGQTSVKPTTSSNKPDTNKNQRPTNPSVSREKAEEIAAQWLTKNGVTDARRDGGTSMDFEHNRWVWEVGYKNRTHEWDFYIDVNTGEVVQVEVERED